LGAFVISSVGNLLASFVELQLSAPFNPNFINPRRPLHMTFCLVTVKCIMLLLFIFSAAPTVTWTPEHRVQHDRPSLQRSRPIVSKTVRLLDLSKACTLHSLQTGEYLEMWKGCTFQMYKEAKPSKQNKLEMWGRAQREATRRCASDWRHNLGKGRVKITRPLPHKYTLGQTLSTLLIAHSGS